MDEPFVVFVIGMRINRPLAVRKWLPDDARDAPHAQGALPAPEKGFLGAEFFLYRWGPAIVQYWRSFEDLERFARNPDDPHLPGLAALQPHGGKDGSVGIFHETFIVERGNFEAIYSNMPVFGLAKATEHVRAVGGARRRAAPDARETSRRSPPPSSRRPTGRHRCSVSRSPLRLRGERRLRQLRPCSAASSSLRIMRWL
jgi:hypothetical protein